MAKEALTALNADSSPQSGSVEVSPTTAGKPTGDNADSPPAGDKQPESLDDFIDNLKVEEGEPGEEAPAERSDSQPEESPPPEDEAEQDSDAKAEQDEPAKEEEPDAETDLFNKRPEWQQLDKALGKEAAKARPIVRKLMAAEHRATERAKAMEPMHKVAEEFKALAGDDAGWKNMQSIIRAYVHDPATAVPILQNMLADARQRGGLEVVDKDLKEQLQEIDRAVDDGTIDTDLAKRQKTILIEAQKARVQARQAQGRLQAGRKDAERQASQQVEGRLIQTLNAWEDSVKKRYPDFGEVTDPRDPNHGSTVADQVFDALRLMRMEQPNAGAEAMVAEADRVFRLAMTRLGRPALRSQKVVTSTGSSAKSKPTARSFEEFVDNLKVE